MRCYLCPYTVTRWISKILPLPRRPIKKSKIEKEQREIGPATHVNPAFLFLLNNALHRFSSSYTHVQSNVRNESRYAKW